LHSGGIGDKIALVHFCRGRLPPETTSKFVDGTEVSMKAFLLTLTLCRAAAGSYAADCEIEFSGGFGELHTESYRKILAGEGFGPEVVRPSIEIVAHTFAMHSPSACRMIAIRW